MSPILTLGMLQLSIHLLQPSKLLLIPFFLPHHGQHPPMLLIHHLPGRVESSQKTVVVGLFIDSSRHVLEMLFNLFNLFRGDYGSALNASPGRLVVEPPGVGDVGLSNDRKQSFGHAGEGWCGNAKDGVQLHAIAIVAIPTDAEGLREVYNEVVVLVGLVLLLPLAHIAGASDFVEWLVHGAIEPAGVFGNGFIYPST